MIKYLYYLLKGVLKIYFQFFKGLVNWYLAKRQESFSPRWKERESSMKEISKTENQMKQKAKSCKSNGRLIEAMDSDHGHQHKEEPSQRGCRYEELQGKAYVPCVWKLGCIKMFKRENHEKSAGCSSVDTLSGVGEGSGR